MKNFIQRNMGYLAVGVNMIIYFLLSYVMVNSFQINLYTIFANGVLLFIGSLISTSAMIKQGLLNGSDNAKYKETMISHLKQKQKIFPKLSYLQPWLNKNHNDLLKIGRQPLVGSAGFDYEEVFREDGKMITTFELTQPEKLKGRFAFIKNLRPELFDEKWKIYKEQKHYISQARKYKVTRLTVSDLMDVESKADPNDLGMTEEEYLKKESGKNLLTKAIMSIILPSFSFTFIGFSWGMFIVQLINMALILFSATFALFSAYSFKVKSHRRSIQRKINKMEEFDNADLSEFKKEGENNVNICTEKSEPTEGSVVETIHGNGESREENNLCSNTNTGV